MTAVDLDALDAARAAAKPGTWRVAANGEDVVSPTHGVVADAYEPADAACIVAEHNAIPDLIADARKYRALREAVEGLAGLVEQGRAWTGDSLARRLRAVLAAAVTSEGERE